MDKTALVSLEIAQAEDALKAMDAASLGIRVAILAHLSSYGDWRLVIAPKILDGERIRH